MRSVDLTAHGKSIAYEQLSAILKYQPMNTGYDRIDELANQHSTIRQMLGHSDWEDDERYQLHTIKDDLRLFTPEILDRINQ